MVTDGSQCKGRCMDNVFVERLWKSVKYEDIYLKAYSLMTEVKNGLVSYFTFYNCNGCIGKKPK